MSGQKPIKPGVYLEIAQATAYAGKPIQVSITKLDENGAGHGHRIAGPKYTLSGSRVLRRVLIDTDTADEIRKYLDLVVDDRMWAVRFANGNVMPVEQEGYARAIVTDRPGAQLLRRDVPGGEWALAAADEVVSAPVRLRPTAHEGQYADDAGRRWVRNDAQMPGSNPPEEPRCEVCGRVLGFVTYSRQVTNTAVACADCVEIVA